MKKPKYPVNQTKFDKALYTTNNVPVNSSSNNFSINNPPTFLGCSFKSWILVFIIFNVLFFLMITRSFNHSQVMIMTALQFINFTANVLAFQGIQKNNYKFLVKARALYVVLLSMFVVQQFLKLMLPFSTIEQLKTPENVKNMSNTFIEIALNLVFELYKITVVTKYIVWLKHFFPNPTSSETLVM